MEEKEFNIDIALNKLEEINRALAASDIELEKSLELYKQGVELAAKCQKHLEGVEKKLQIINTDEAGE